ncbi:DNA-binding protein [Glaciibacter psychrotolerans]|uniref:DNA-binding protein n=1 Tax=Glaciibacter psychrotolerans TaxID=670054 RepID=UPI0031B59B2E
MITADQINSRADIDRAGALLQLLISRFGPSFELAPDQTAGDEVQMMTTDAAVALEATLAIHRTGRWSVGLGLGPVRTPLPAATRQAAGPAFIAARAGVTRAKRTDTHFALESAQERRSAPTSLDGSDEDMSAAEVEALIGIVLLLRQRRTPEGWEAIDLLHLGFTQGDAAERLGISTAAISQRLKTAAWRAETAARPALVRLLEHLHRQTIETGPSA